MEGVGCYEKGEGCGIELWMRNEANVADEIGGLSCINGVKDD